MSYEQNTIKVSTRNFNKLVDTLNHRVTGLESTVTDIKNDLIWVKKIGYYLSGILTLMVGKLVFF